MSVSIPHAHERAKATPVSRERFPMPAGHRGAWLRRPWAVAGPGRASRRRAERSSQRGRRAGGPPPTGAQSSPARQVRPNGAQNTSEAASNKLNREFRLRRPWAVAGPGRASSRRAEPHISDQAPLVWRAPEGPEGLAAAAASYGGAWLRRPWVAAGPGRASRSTTPSRRLACGDLAGGPPPTGTHSGRAPQSSARAPARHSKRGRHQPTPCASALTHP